MSIHDAEAGQEERVSRRSFLTGQRTSDVRKPILIGVGGLILSIPVLHFAEKLAALIPPEKTDRKVVHSGVPRSVEEVIGDYKGQPETWGFRFSTDEYTIVSGREAFVGQQQGPGVAEGTDLESCRRIADFAKKKQESQEPIEFHGRLCIQDDQPYRYEGRLVMLLDSIRYQGLEVRVR